MSKTRNSPYCGLDDPNQVPTADEYFRGVVLPRICYALAESVRDVHLGDWRAAKKNWVSVQTLFAKQAVYT